MKNLFTGDIIDATEFLHDVIMNGDEGQATAARCLKEIIPRFAEWLATEINRGTKPYTVLQAMSSVCASLVGTVIQNAEHDETTRREAIAAALRWIALEAAARADAQREAAKANGAESQQ